MVFEEFKSRVVEYNEREVVKRTALLYNGCCVIKYANFILAFACESEEQRSVQLWKCEG